MLYKFLADLVLILHFIFIIFVVIGGLLALLNVKWVWLHIPAAIWGGLIEFTGWICPLTHVENWLRLEEGAGMYHQSFISHYLLPIIYPNELTRNVQIALGIGVVSINLLMYAVVFFKIKTRVKKSAL